MDAVVVRQFFNFFQDFLHLCQLESWPDDDTTEFEIRNAFLAAQHVEKSLNRFQKRNVVNEFLSTLNSAQNTSNLLLKNCFIDPTRYILKKIINSKTKISQMDAGFKVFLQLFSEKKLEKCLAELMLESASKETLLRNMSTELTKDQILEFKSFLLLTELNSREDPKDTLMNLLQNGDRETLDILVVSVLNTDIKYNESVNQILNAFKQIMSSKNYKHKTFWKLLFNVDDKYLFKLCLQHAVVFKLMMAALFDCGTLISQQMSLEYFYIDLDLGELRTVFQKICKNEHLKVEIFRTIKHTHGDIIFWTKLCHNP